MKRWFKRRSKQSGSNVGEQTLTVPGASQRESSPTASHHQISPIPSHPPSPCVTMVGIPLKMIAQRQDQFPQVSLERRYEVRDITKQRVATSLGFEDFETAGNHVQSKHVPEQMKSDFEAVPVVLFPGGDPGQGLLRIFDVIQTPCRLDFDDNFHPATYRTTFPVFHTAALNVGERARAADFARFSHGGRLHEQGLSAATFSLWRRISMAADFLHHKELVIVPLGMGAFLRNLHLNDRSLPPEDTKHLRFLMADKMLEAISTFKKFHIHLCLQTGTNEANMNFNAFASAIDNMNVDLKCSLYINVDACALAQRLSDQKRKVVLVNAANRCLLGNHWFRDGARFAIDENLHRRSTLLSTASLLLNGGITPKYDSTQLSLTTMQVGGTIIDLERTI